MSAIVIERVSVVVAHEQQFVGECLGRVLGRPHTGIEVVGEAQDGEGVIAEVLQKRPRVVLLAADLPRSGFGSPLAAIREALERDIKAVVIGEYHNKLDAAYILREGVTGYLPESISSERLVTAIHTVATGGLYLPGGFLKNAVQRIVGDHGARRLDLVPQLSARQIEILQLAARGFSRRVTAGQLVLSERTVEAHRAHAYRALGVSNITEAVLKALWLGLISLD